MIDAFFDTPAASHFSVFTVLLANLLLFSHNEHLHKCHLSRLIKYQCYTE